MILTPGLLMYHQISSLITVIVIVYCLRLCLFFLLSSQSFAPLFHVSFWCLDSTDPRLSFEVWQRPACQPGLWQMHSLLTHRKWNLLLPNSWKTCHSSSSLPNRQCFDWNINVDGQVLIYLSDSVTMLQRCFETQIADLTEIWGFPSLPCLLFQGSVLKCCSLRNTEDTHADTHTGTHRHIHTHTHVAKLVKPSGSNQAAVAHWCQWLSWN